MYLKNPNPKVSYSFRINPELLDNLKLYADATNQSVPQVITDLITEKLDGVTLTNDYLDGYENQLITIPDLQTIYDNTNTVETYEKIDLLNPHLEGNTYTILKTLNNLDVWDSTDDINGFNQHGYTSHNYPKILHEGLEVYLAPELITTELLQRDDNTIILPFCLLFVHFSIAYNKRLEINLLTYREALDKIKEINNFELMQEVSNRYTEVTLIINSVISDIPETLEVNTPIGKTAWENKTEMYNDYTEELKNRLYLLSKEINTGNIIYNKSKVRKITVPDDEIITLEYTDNDINQLKRENQALQERVTYLENKFKDLDSIIFKGIDKESLQKMFELLD